MLGLGMAACGDDSGDDNASESTTTSAAAKKGSDKITVEYVDYAYEVSGPLTEGGAIEFTNSGKEFHMAIFAKLKKGKTLEDVQQVIEEQSGGGEEESSEEENPAVGATTTTTAAEESPEEEEDPLAEVADGIGLPGNIMSPGATAAATIPDLGPGTYAMMCFIPTEGEGTPHVAKGMLNQIEVVEGDTPAEPTADATYKVEPGKAVQGPATLTAGTHTLKIEGVGEAGDLEPAIAKLNPGTTFSQMDKALSTLFESEDEAPPVGAASKIPGKILWGGFDLQETPSYYLTLTLDAGNYVLVAEDTDAEDSGTAPPKELLNIKVS